MLRAITGVTWLARKGPNVSAPQSPMITLGTPASSSRNMPITEASRRGSRSTITSAAPMETGTAIISAIATWRAFPRSRAGRHTRRRRMGDAARGDGLAVEVALCPGAPREEPPAIVRDHGQRLDQQRPQDEGQCEHRDHRASAADPADDVAIADPGRAEPTRAGGGAWCPLPRPARSCARNQSSVSR